ncbi:MAG: hypothetical protein CBC35_06140 [Planctomycetes bacterium TMED75]|nr:nucleotide-binding protein [Planctomycetaceae bacterium]OUU93139.1 MAG: hypothetical protein CBC35_06140 [Planctomycetes bacterium TMED75]
MQRLLTPELMDDPKLDPLLHAQALRGLARLNLLAGSDRIPWKPLRRWIGQRRGPFDVLDIATGSGDVPLGLGIRARRAGIDLVLHGCDVSDFALDQARQRAQSLGLKFTGFQQDAIRDPFKRQYDVVLCNLFLHHLEEDEAIQLLQHAASACSGLLLVCDLRRDRLGWLLAAIFSRLVTRCSVVHVDALKSVRAGFTPEELDAMAARAGLESRSMHRCFPRRMLLQWSPVDA